MAHQAHLDGHQSQAETMFTFTAISFTSTRTRTAQPRKDVDVYGEAS